MRTLRAISIWGALAGAVAVPILAAGMSPLLAWRDQIYIAAGFAGIVGLSLLLVQPLLIRGYVPGLVGPIGRKAHRWLGGLLATAVVLHVAGLWITSPPDVVDALLFRSPTPFSIWGVVAMWAVFGAAMLAVFRRRLRIRPKIWAIAHRILAAIVVIGTIVHALLIEGTMEITTKIGLSALVAVAAGVTLLQIKTSRVKPHRKPQ